MRQTFAFYKPIDKGNKQINKGNKQTNKQANKEICDSRKGEPNMMKNMTLKKGKQKMILKKVNQSLVELPAPVSCPPSPPL